MATHVQMDVEDEIPEFPPEYWNTPITALRMTTRTKLSRYLDLDGELAICNGEDIVTNYHGLAELADFTYLEMQNLARHRSPTMEFLDSWDKKQLHDPYVGKLWDFLVKMNRRDVLVDCINNFVKDCKSHLDLKQMQDDEFFPIQVDEVTDSDMLVNEEKYATIHDVTNPSGAERVMYDAFVCYSPEAKDLKFVKEMIQKLEGQEYGLKLFVPGRDDIPGAAQYTINAYLIEERCRRMIIIATHNFERSAACDFYVKFAHALSPGARTKKLIPVLVDLGARLPRILKFLAVCDFTKEDMRCWVWGRLAAAISAPIERKSSHDYIKSVADLKRLELSNSASYTESFNADGQQSGVCSRKPCDESNKQQSKNGKKGKKALSTTTEECSQQKQPQSSEEIYTGPLPGDWVIPESSTFGPPMVNPASMYPPPGQTHHHGGVAYMAVRGPAPREPVRVRYNSTSQSVHGLESSSLQQRQSSRFGHPQVSSTVPNSGGADDETFENLEVYV